jgi:8-oxo-dGTP pyrophosphatase MutT (NUDIX family)
MSHHNVRDEQLPTGAGSAGEVPAVPAASTIVLRGESPFEILLLRRHERSTFVPGAWVFPGGALEATDQAGDELETMRRCALRELQEETGIALDRVEDLVWTARWVTPVGVPKRFDTWFFLVQVEEGTIATADQQEGVEVLWITPRAALGRFEAGDLKLVFPTVRNIEAIAGYASAGELLASRRGVEIPTTRPQLVVEGGKKKIILPE